MACFWSRDRTKLCISQTQLKSQFEILKYPRMAPREFWGMGATAV